MAGLESGFPGRKNFKSVFSQLVNYSISIELTVKTTVDFYNS